MQLYDSGEPPDSPFYLAASVGTLELAVPTELPNSGKIGLRDMCQTLACCTVWGLLMNHILLMFESHRHRFQQDRHQH